MTCFPGANLIGMAVSGATAALLTTTFGEIYIAVLAKLFEGNAGEPPSVEEVAAAFKSAIQQKTKA